MRFVTGSATDVGRVRAGNEDDLLVDDALGLVAVADGMGGHQAGEVASATALEALRAAAASGRPLTDAIEFANTAVYEKASADPSLRGMGTTLTALTTRGGTRLGHVGDSRAYRLRDEALHQLTTDHSLVEELVREGRLTPEEAAVHPKRSIITRALGIESEVRVDEIPVDLVAGDRLLLCSDGLTSMLRDDDVAILLRRYADPTIAARALIDAANAAGGDDNITVIVIDVVDDDTPAGVVITPWDEEADLDGDGPTEAIDTGMVVPKEDETRAVPAVSIRPPDAPDPKPKSPNRARRIRRIVFAVVPVLFVLGLAVAATAWYAHRDYYLAEQNGKVVVYNGTPGGLLGFGPTREYTTRIVVADLPAVAQQDVDEHRSFSSRSDVDDFVDRLTQATTTTTSSTTSTSTTSTTTAPGPATTTLVGP